jgi:hypothetical protein
MAGAACLKPVRQLGRDCQGDREESGDYAADPYRPRFPPQTSVRVGILFSDPQHGLGASSRSKAECFAASGREIELNGPDITQRLEKLAIFCGY